MQNYNYYSTSTTTTAVVMTAVAGNAFRETWDNGLVRRTWRVLGLKTGASGQGACGSDLYQHGIQARVLT